MEIKLGMVGGRRIVYITPIFQFHERARPENPPEPLFEEESVACKLLNPENEDLVAIAVGSIGPCVRAPLFEEMLYREYLFPALTCFFSLTKAIQVSAVLFAVNHLNPTSMLPLTMLGLVWTSLYVQPKNFTVTILIHAMCNSRVFLGSLLGLRTFNDFEWREQFAWTITHVFVASWSVIWSLG